ncbi:MAG: lipopolysaccharide kinase InaA family protein [Pseudomonadota bacterium]
MINTWQLTELGRSVEDMFTNLDAVFALKGEEITHDRLSDVIKIEHQNIRYYVKRYVAAGKGFRRFIGKPRIQGEWENLQWFEQCNIPTASLIGYGFEKKWGLFKRGAIITQEIPNTQNLEQFANQKKLLNNDLVKIISRLLATYTSKLHKHSFVHNDLKWRNVLVNDSAQVFLIDCPLGDFWRGSMLSYRIVKDLKSLDNYAKKYLRRTQRLRFFLDYVNSESLDSKSKKLLLQLLKRRSRRYDNQSKFRFNIKELIKY